MRDEVIGENTSVSPAMFQARLTEASWASGEWLRVIDTTLVPQASVDFAGLHDVARAARVFEIATTMFCGPSRAANIENVCGSE